MWPVATYLPWRSHRWTDAPVAEPAARAKQKEEFEAWQEVWRTLRMAERALDIEYEFIQMRDYY